MAGSKELEERVRLDSKGRISIPAWIRRAIGVDEETEIVITFDLAQPEIKVRFENGQPEVTSQKDCSRSCTS